MNTENEKRLDDLFKKKLEDPVDEIRYEEGDWDALEQLLDKPKRRKIAYLWPVLSGIAAMLLLFIGWWLFVPKAGNGNDNNQQVKVQQKKDTIIGNKIAVAPEKADTIIDGTKNIAKQNVKDTIVDRTQAIANKKNAIIKSSAKPQLKTPMPDANKPMFAVTPVKRDTIVDKVKQPNKVANDAFALNQTPVQTPVNVQQPAAATQPPVTKPATADTQGQAIAATAPAKVAKPKTRLAYRPQYTLGFVAAPDINGVGSFAQSKVGTNIGMTFAVGVSRKLTFSTGAIYSVKPYLTNFNNYNTGSAYKWAVNPVNVTADCRMFDIPLNVNYQVYRKQQNRISLGTGLSSYIMLHESYKFNYAYDGATGPPNYKVPNPGQYFFGVVNLNATYERQINSKVGISIQPYMKLPLTNIGYSQVKLQTTGVAVGLSWNLNSLTKP